LSIKELLEALELVDGFAGEIIVNVSGLFSPTARFVGRRDQRSGEDFRFTMEDSGRLLLSAWGRRYVATLPCFGGFFPHLLNQTSIRHKFFPSVGRE